MNDIPQKLAELDKAISELSIKHGFQNAKKAINAVINLLNIDVNDQWKLFSDSNGKIRSNAGWFMLAEGFADRRAAYKIVENNEKNIDFKAYWMKNMSKVITSWLIALTPNFEDEPFFKSKNIGIDFIIPEKSDRIIVVLSHNYVIRTLELFEHLSLTQQEIFAKWLEDFDFENKAQAHENLWHSFDLESVNKNFYKKISSFFVELKQYLADKKIFNEKHSALFANRLMGRVIFCWFLDKKSFISPQQKYFDLEGKNSTEYYRTKLEKLFFRTLNIKIKDRGEDVFNLIGELDTETPFLNGGLFTPRDDDYFGLKKITFPADYFDRFYEFLKHYNFTTDESTSSFQQVAIDPEMLGRVFENLLAEQVEETGEQARKAKGAFYTPREIVEYMCKESLREYLKSKIEKTDDSDQRINQLLDSKPHEWRDQQRNYRDKLKQYKYKILQALDEVKMIDPACGSGAFPMGMLQLLLQTYERIDSTFDSYKKKLEIIKNNLFGVDIEPMAVEIARLRAWLSIIVDEDLNPKIENMGIHPLPNLDFKFVCANSLIPAPLEKEHEWIENSFFDELEQKAKEFFEINDVEKKEAKKHELQELVNRKVKEKLDNTGQLSIGLNMGKFNGEYKKKNNKAIEENIKLMELWGSYTNIFTADEPVGFFETKYFFPSVKEGFDIVIGNPPYVQLQKNHGKFADMYKDCNYQSFERTGDIYALFYENGINNLKIGGHLCFITSNKWMRAGYGKSLRKFFNSQNPILLVDLGPGIFENATVDTNILLIRKENNQGQLAGVKVNSEAKDAVLSDFINKNKNILSKMGEDAWFIGSDAEQKLKEKIERIGKPLKEWDVNIYYGIKTGLNEAFIIDTSTKERLCQEDPKSAEILKPILRGRDIKRYGYEWAELWIIGTFPALKLNIDDYPAVKKYLLDFGKDRLEQEGNKLPDGTTSRKKTGNKWFETQDQIAYYPEFEKEKVVWKALGLKPAFCLVKDHIFNNDKGNLLTSKSIPLKFLCGVLNSKLFDWQFSNIGINMGQGFEYKIQFINLIVIPPITPSNKSIVEQIENIVEKILSAKKQNPKTNTTSLEKQIDEIVYELYGLTEEEREIVEGNNVLISNILLTGKTTDAMFVI